MLFADRLQPPIAHLVLMTSPHPETEASTLDLMHLIRLFE